MARLQEFYRDKVAPDLIKKFGYKSPMQVPRITKITLNMGVSEAVADKKVIDNAVGDLTEDRRPEARRHQVEEGHRRLQDPRGHADRLHGHAARRAMYEFLDRFVTIALPRVRDFRGISGRAFDGRGNYNIGVKEQIIFPEIEYDKIDALRGLNICITTTAKTDEECQGAARRVPFPVQELRRPRGKDFPDPARTEARKAGRQVREEARRTEGDRERRQEDRRRALRRPPGAAEAAAQRQPDAPAQPLRNHRSSARHLPQVRPGPQQDPRTGFQGRHPRRHQGQLVSRREEKTT